jgi:hypothetical protein
MSLKAMVNPAAREPGPLVTLVRSRTVAKVDSMGLVVLRLSQCSAGEVVECQQRLAVVGDLGQRLGHFAANAPTLDP